MYVFVSKDHMLDWHSFQICYPIEIKLLLFQYLAFYPKCVYDKKKIKIQKYKRH